MLLSPIRHLHISPSQNPSCLQLPPPPPPNNVISPGYYIRRKRNWKQRLYKMLKGEQTRCIFEICENGSILRTAVADKEKFDDEFCSEFKYDIF